ncbi:DegV family protein [Fusicatenibacter sp. CLA-AA-H213]|nr:DegV family protein [Fusicatenibacter sp. CLA-AA-H213]
MGNVAIVTDSNSGISQAEGKELGIYVIPMPFLVDGKLYFEDVDMNKEQFYHFLENDADLSTSQPSPGDVMDLWDKLLKEYDEIVHIPMSSGLSASCSTAMGLARDYDGKVQVVDNQRISVTMQQSVMDAKHLVAAGKSAAQIKEILEKEALESSIYLMVDTLKYLKKGGRITPSAALLGSALNLKPILQIQGDKLDAYKKVRGVKAAKKNMLEAMKKDVEGRFSDYVTKGQLKLHVAYTTDEETARQWKEEVQSVFPNIAISRMDPLSFSVTCHTGPGVLAIAASHVLDGVE